MSESAIYGIEMVIVLPLSLKESVDPAPSFAVGKYNFAVGKYNFAVREYNIAVPKYNLIWPRNILRKARRSIPLTVRSSWFEGFSL